MSTATVSPANPSDDENEANKPIDESRSQKENSEETIEFTEPATVEFEETPLVPEGDYQFKIESSKIQLKVPTSYGPKNKVKFEFAVIRTDEETGETEVGVIRRSYNISKASSSDLMKFTAQLGLPKPDSRFDPSVYIGISGYATVEHVTVPTGDTIAVLGKIHR